MLTEIRDLPTRELKRVLAAARRELARRQQEFIERCALSSGLTDVEATAHAASASTQLHRLELCDWAKVTLALRSYLLSLAPAQREQMSATLRLQPPSVESQTREYLDLFVILK